MADGSPQHHSDDVQGYLNPVLEEGHIHHCYTCRIGQTRELETFQNLTIIRRALYSLWHDGYHFSNAKEFGRSIGIADLRTASGILQRLVTEGWLMNGRKNAESPARGTKGNKKLHTAYSVVRSAANERRLRTEYFDPRKGLEDYLKSSIKVETIPETQSTGQANKDKELDQASNIGQAVAVPLLTNLQIAEGLQSSSQPEVSSTADLQKPTCVSTSKRKRNFNSSGPGESRSINRVATADTMDDDVDEDLGQAIPSQETSTTIRTPRRQSPRKKQRASIVEKPIIARAY